MRDDLRDCSIYFERIILNVDNRHPSKVPQPSGALHLLALSRAIEVTIDGVFWEQNVQPRLVTQDNDGWSAAVKGGFASLNETGEIIGSAKFGLQPNVNSFGEYSCRLLLE